jgi:hypothetical protein
MLLASTVWELLMSNARSDALRGATGEWLKTTAVGWDYLPLTLEAQI